MSEIISLSEIGKKYLLGQLEVLALKGITLFIEKNEYVALMGPSGSGKSTLMNILGCLDSPTSGQYFLNGLDVSSMSDADLAETRNRQIGFIFQTFNLLPRLTALENLVFKRSERDEMGKEALDLVGLHDRMLHKPNELSGGQRQRVAIARAIVSKPSIILADEPTGNLDTKTSIEIMAILEEIHKRGNTIVLVTHEPDISEYAHRIIRLRDGIVESDQKNLNIVTVDNSD